VLRSVRLEGGQAESSHVAAGGSSLWTVNGGELTRVDQLGRPTGSADVGQGSTAIAAGLDAVWIADDLQGNLTKVAPDTLRVLKAAEVPGNIDAIAVGVGSVWIVDSDAGVVTPFDPTSLSAEPPVRVGVNPTDLAVGLESVWVSNQGDGTISRIDPVTHAVDSIPIGAPAAAIAVDDVQACSGWRSGSVARAATRPRARAVHPAAASIAPADAGPSRGWNQVGHRVPSPCAMRAELAASSGRPPTSHRCHRLSHRGFVVTRRSRRSTEPARRCLGRRTPPTNGPRRRRP
jgi:streptogramin lyase